MPKELPVSSTLQGNKKFQRESAIYLKRFAIETMAEINFCHAFCNILFIFCTEPHRLARDDTACLLNFRLSTAIAACAHCPNCWLGCPLVNPGKTLVDFCNNDVDEQRARHASTNACRASRGYMWSCCLLGRERAAEDLSVACGTCQCPGLIVVPLMQGRGTRMRVSNADLALLLASSQATCSARMSATWLDHDPHFLLTRHA